jgi:hypothetical protein
VSRSGPGRDAVRRLARTSGVVVSSGLAVAEVSAAFHRTLREAAVRPAVFKALQGQFVHDLDKGSGSSRIVAASRSRRDRSLTTPWPRPPNSITMAPRPRRRIEGAASWGICSTRRNR